MIRLLVSLLLWSLRALLKSSGTLVIENLDLRQQLAAYARCEKRVHLQPQERMFWATLSQVWTAWRSALIVVKPATVIAWHRRGIQGYWRWRSRKPGRPRIPGEHIALIRRISSDHPEWGEDKIAEELAIKLGVTHSISTICRYMVSRRKPRDGQTWRTFIKNHAKQIYVCDFLTQYTLSDAPNSDKEARGRTISSQIGAARARWLRDTLDPRPSIRGVEGFEDLCGGPNGYSRITGAKGSGQPHQGQREAS